MTSYLQNYVKRIKDIKKLAREKSTLWVFPLFDSLGIEAVVETVSKDGKMFQPKIRRNGSNNKPHQKFY